VRSGDVTPMAPCLRKLVPILQQAQVDYLHDPLQTNKIITDAAAAYNDGWTYTMGTAEYSADVMKRLKIIANDSTGPLGGMDPTRLQSTIDTFAPLLARAGAAVKPGLTPADIATTRFIDPGIRLN
jgi:hypothetical protein